MVATTQFTNPRQLGDDPEAAYFRWLPPGAAAAGSGRAEQIFRRHRELAAVRAPGSAATRVYRPGDAGGLGAAVQIVNDDMPMLVDSVTAALRRLGGTVTEVIHPVFAVTRDGGGALTGVAVPDGEPLAGLAESWIHVQLAPDLTAETADRIAAALPPLLHDLRRVAEHRPAMLGTLGEVAGSLDRAAARADDPEIAECAELLRWMGDGHFTVLGYGYYRIRRANPTADEAWQVPGTGLGVLRNDGSVALTVPLLGPKRSVLRMSNGTVESLLPGSRDLYFVSVADYGAGERGQAVVPGETVRMVQGEHVFVGTFAVTGLHENILDIPVVSRRALQAIARSGLALDSFSGQTMLELMQSFPRAELFSTDARRLYETVTDVMTLGLRRQLRLFVRRDVRSDALYCLVYLPRDRYSAEVRRRMTEVLRAEYGGERITYSARATESELAVLYFTVHRAAGATPADLSDDGRARVQQLLQDATLTWADRLRGAAAAAPDITPALLDAYADAFPPSYRDEHGPDRALADLRRLERLRDGEIDTRLARDAGAPSGEWRFTLYLTGAGVSLSRVLPVLHSLGVEVVDERPHRVRRADAADRWILDFGLRVPAALLRGALDPELEAGLGAGDIGAGPRTGVGRGFPDAVEAMWFGYAEVDGLNELVLRAGLHWRQIAMLRAYAKYLRQAGFPYTFDHITRVLLGHPAIAAACAELFAARFDPDAPEPTRGVRAAALAVRLRAAIDEVTGLDADRILRAVHGLIEATLRTNHYRRDAAGRPPEYLSCKLDPPAIAELPEPRPKYEIFVYSPRVEGVHLRFGSVARGGLRWSDRLEDFRTEILGLVKAQAVKNAVIVPVGAKGGFVVKHPPAPTGDPGADRKAALAEGIACYRTFIAGLLDLTDNVDRATGETRPPTRVVRRDGDDSYLVVAADKGTATFSDIANEVAGEYGFWLGDAFASGGSAGYDHKAMGITARGAWTSVERHFHELDVDVRTQDFTVVGVGDMSGDVFGNGMLLSEHIRLVAAFDHRHIFLDPAPDAARSHAERARLFALPRSSWADYDTALISPGGGVHDRTAKSIPVTPEVRAALGIAREVTALAPAEMIRAALQAPVDLLWNGGIGTYVKASTESDAEVGDKGNDAVRVDADRLRVKVIGEGGNLGVTALGRIEFCRAGGRMNTDALDNAAGVDCSDHEVNIKVLLDAAVSAGELAAADRDPLLASMTDEVAELVLRNNIAQNVRLGISRADAPAMLGVHRRLIGALESGHGLDRRLAALPTDAELDRRGADGRGLSSPELANLMAHVKLALKAELLDGELLDGPAFAGVLPGYFPAPLRERFGAAISRHPLRRRIVATVVVNDMVDNGGITYAFRLAEEAGATTEDAVRACTVASAIFDLPVLRERIRSTPMPTAVRDQLELEAERTLDRASRWLLANRPQPIAIGAEIARYWDRVRVLADAVPALLTGYLAADLAARSRWAVEHGAPADIAAEVYRLIQLCPLLDAVDVAEIAERDPAEVTALMYALNEHFAIERLLTAVGRLARGDRWHTLARLAVRDDLYESWRLLTRDVLAATGPQDGVAAKIAYWESINRARLARAGAALREIFAADDHDIATLSVAARQVRGLVGGESGNASRSG
ncbi:NAD-glutamate dehydrogenase [Nocardia sp. NPDC057227]|uniref:NAD-glutamate dehydrogenase n=1 Tax=Nocardia sp. NPDC057227 TaxID=3346056 RepID=UPI003627100C